MKYRTDRISSSIALHTPLHPNAEQNSQAPFDWSLEPDDVVVQLSTARAKANERAEAMRILTSTPIEPVYPEISEASYLPEQPTDFTIDESLCLDAINPRRIYAGFAASAMIALYYASDGFKNVAYNVSNPEQVIDALSTLI